MRCSGSRGCPVYGWPRPWPRPRPRPLSNTTANHDSGHGQGHGYAQGYGGTTSDKPAAQPAGPTWVESLECVGGLGGTSNHRFRPLDTNGTQLDARTMRRPCARAGSGPLSVLRNMPPRSRNHWRSYWMLTSYARAFSALKTM